jgi:N-acetylmuramic acid 6-phosphate etherase
MVTLDLSQLQTESRNGKTTNIDEVSTLEMCYMINTEDAGVSSAVRKCLPAIAAAIDATAPRIREGGRLVYVGAGTSGR